MAIQVNRKNQSMRAKIRSKRTQQEAADLKRKAMTALINARKKAKAN